MHHTMFALKTQRKFGDSIDSAGKQPGHAVVSCIEDHIMENFLTDHRSEVLSVCITEFDEEKFIRTVKAEGKADEIVRTVMEPDYAKKLMLMYGI